MMRTTFVASLLWFAFGDVALAQETPALIVDRNEVWSHLDGPELPTGIEWRPGADLFEELRGVWQTLLTVDVSGRVTEVRIVDGPENDRAAAAAAARAMRFRPFERDGRAVAAVFPFDLVVTARDYYGPAERRFPEEIELSSVRIRLARSGCGPDATCPDFLVEVHGDGNVSFHGESNVLAKGEHRWRIPTTDVEALLALLRRADYFNLDGHYVLGIFHFPAYVTTVEIGDQRKFVYDYAGIALGGTFAGRQTEPMPSAVTEVEDGIERLSGASSWVRGDERTLAALQAANFDFRSEAGSEALRVLVSRCNVSVAREFLAAGAFVDAEDTVARAERCQDAAFAEELRAASTR